MIASLVGLLILGLILYAVYLIATMIIGVSEQIKKIVAIVLLLIFILAAVGRLGGYIVL